MLKKLLITVIGKTVSKKMKLVDDTATPAPAPGQPLVSVPWYESRTKLTVLVGVVLYAINHLSGPVFGHPITISPDVYKLLEAVGLYTLRDAIKKPE